MLGVLFKFGFISLKNWAYSLFFDSDRGFVFWIIAFEGVAYYLGDEVFTADFDFGTSRYPSPSNSATDTNWFTMSRFPLWRSESRPLPLLRPPLLANDPSEPMSTFSLIYLYNGSILSLNLGSKCFYRSSCYINLNIFLICLKNLMCASLSIGGRSSITLLVSNYTAFSRSLK